MKRYLYILFMIALAACSTKTPQVQPQTEVIDNRPYWLQNRPVASDYYIGIGASVKHGQETEYIQMAKKQALSDMSSEIRVNLSSNSMLYQLDKGHSFKEEYMSSVRTSTQEELEGYEMVGSWENEREFWVYYRLSKPYWKELQKNKKQQAISKAEDFFGKARSYEKQGQMRLALSSYFQSLETLKNYYAEAIEIEYEGKNILLLNEAYDAVRRILGNVELIPDQKELTIKKGVARQTSLDFLAVYRDPKTGELLPFKRLPVSVTFGNPYDQEKLVTDQQGHAAFTAKPKGNINRQVIELQADYETLVKSESEERFVHKMVETVIPAKTQIVLTIQSPKVFMSSSEVNLGSPVAHQPVAGVLKNLLTEQGYVFTEQRSEAELFVSITAQTRQGGAASDFQSTYLDVEISVSDPYKGITLYSQTLNDIKGVHMSYEQAGMVAYKKSAEVLRKKVLPELINKIQ